MEEWLLYCVCTRWNSVRSSTLGHQKLLKMYFFKSFWPTHTCTIPNMQRKYSITKIELLAIVQTLKDFKGMLWGQNIKLFSNHANLMKDALGLTSDQVYQWRLLLEEYGHEIVYIKGIHNTVADAVLRLEYDPSVN